MTKKDLLRQKLLKKQTIEGARKTYDGKIDTMSYDIELISINALVDFLFERFDIKAEDLLDDEKGVKND